jgi:hypothetical protein
MAEVPAADRPVFAAADAYYLGKAREQAAFTLNCPTAQVNVSAVSTKPAYLWAEGSDHRAFNLAEGVMIATIGAVGCDQRTTYQVLCAPGQVYTAIHGGPCDTLPSNDAPRVVDKNNREQKSKDDEAAAAAAAAAQQQAGQRR